MRRAALSCLALIVPFTLRGQGVTERPPVMSGDWVGTSGSIYFNFLHRFSESGAPEHKVSSFPTFVLGAALPWNTLVGVTYASNSVLALRYPNEHEYFLRLMPYARSRGGLFDFGVQGGYNDAARGADAEATLALQAGPLRLLSSGRVLKGVGDDVPSTQIAVAGGAVLRLHKYVAIAGDVGGLTKRDASEKLAWSAGLQLQIPLTPHTLSLHAANVTSNTLQGSSRGADRVRYGFEFTIPVTLRRYFGPRAPQPAVAPGAEAAAPSGPATVAHISGMAFRQARIEIAVGTTVEWKNDDPLAHTVTALDGSFTSPIIEPGQSWRRTFDRAGEYAFYCTPHPFMRGVVVVR